MKPILTIQYCPKCRWLMRASYMAQELLTSFEEELGGVMLVPAPVNGQYTISIDRQVVFDRKTNGGFLDITLIKQLVRDHIAPGKNLGHVDRKKSTE